MSSAFKTLQDQFLQKALRELFVPKLKAILKSRNAGHCMRLSDLDIDLMILIAIDLNKCLVNNQVFILKSDGIANENNASDFFISSSKLIELRNPLADGSLAHPILILIPHSVQTSAEDSFGIATFEEIIFSDVYSELVNTQLPKIPLPLQGHINEILQYLKKENWPWASSINQARFLLTALQNGVDGETLGAALYELGLIPDFYLFDDPSITLGRVKKNLEITQEITYSNRSTYGRILDLGLEDQYTQRLLAQLLHKSGLEDPRSWTTKIVLNQDHWDLSFHKWKFSGEKTPDKLSIKVLSIDLPTVSAKETDVKLQNLIGQKILLPKRNRTIKVKFEVDPHPTQVSGLAYFSVQITSAADGPIGIVKTTKKWTGKQLVKTVTLSKLNQYEIKDGWHFLRLLAWTENNEPISLVREDNLTESLNESEQFFVFNEKDVREEQPEKRAIPRDLSLEHAILNLQLSSMQNMGEMNDLSPDLVSWANKTARGQAANQQMILARFDQFGDRNIPIYKALKDIEHKILSQNSLPAVWRLEINKGQLGNFECTKITAQKFSTLTDFIETRKVFMQEIFGGEDQLLTQAANFTQVMPACVDYATAYRALLIDLKIKIEQSSGIDRTKLISTLRHLLAIDSVHVVVRDYSGRKTEAVLLGPTHPLRALWFATWKKVGQYWVEKLSQASREHIGYVRDSLQSLEMPSNMPIAIPLLDGRVFVALDNIHPFWTLYTYSGEINPRGLLTTITSALKLPSRDIGNSTINGKTLANRLERYLLQHPYVHTLRLNVFNPGDVSILVDALVVLQKQSLFTHMHYDIRIFSTSPEESNIGEAFDEKIFGAGSSNSEAIDALAGSSGSHLFPKVTYAIHSIQEFAQNPSDFTTNLSILFNLFPAEDIGSKTISPDFEHSPLHGLVQEFSTQFQEDEAGTYWIRQPVHGTVTPLSSEDNLTTLTAELPKIISGAIATVANGIPAFDERPAIILGLNAQARELLYHIHDVSDWVITIDRNMGIEFFDHGGTRDRPEYIIDYSPGSGIENGYQLFVTSRSLSELEAMLRPVLKQFGLFEENKDISQVFHHLRSLSGRLALKLISSPAQQTEALGLALSRLLLWQQGALENQIIVPLDDHISLFSDVKKYADELGNTINVQRTDLALFDLNAAKRTITCNLIEVKCYTSVGSLSAYTQLKNSIREQLNTSEEVLRKHFDPEFTNPDRPDRLVKTLEFRRILEFYLLRAIRYGIISEGSDTITEAKILLSKLEGGYKLEFTKSALIFDFDKPGTEKPETEGDVDFHRIGVDLIKKLVHQEIADDKETATVDEFKSRLPELEHLTSASFIPPQRDRAEALEAIDSLGDESLEETPEIYDKGRCIILSVIS